MKEVTVVVLDGSFRILLGLLLAVPALAADAPKTLKACAVTWPPFVTFQGGNAGGTDTKILQEAVKALGYAGVEIKDIPWKRCLKMAETGEIDIVFPASKKPDREVYLHYPKTPLHPVSYVFVVKAGNTEEWSTKKSVASLPQPIGVPLGYSIAEQLHKEPGAQFDENAKDDLVNLQKLLKGRVGTIVIEKMNGQDLIQQLNATDKVKILSEPYFKDKEYYVTVSKKSPEAETLMKGLDKVLPGLVPKVMD